GADTALELALKAWARADADRGGAGRVFEVITGTATTVDKQRFEGWAGEVPGTYVRFHSTVLPGGALLLEMIGYLRERDGRRNKIALLKEADTGYGLSIRDSVKGGAADQWKDFLEVVELPFPLYISRVRTAYSRGESDKPRETSPAGTSRTRIPFPLEESNPYLDADPVMSPDLTAATV